MNLGCQSNKTKYFTVKLVFRMVSLVSARSRGRTQHMGVRHRVGHGARTGGQAVRPGPGRCPTGYGPRRRQARDRQSRSVPCCLLRIEYGGGGKKGTRSCEEANLTREARPRPPRMRWMESLGVGGRAASGRLPPSLSRRSIHCLDSPRAAHAGFLTPRLGPFRLVTKNF